MSNEKVLIKGNYAIAQAAVNAGLQCYFGYPITPQTEIGEYLSLHSIQITYKSPVILWAKNSIKFIFINWGL